MTVGATGNVTTGTAPDPAVDATPVPRVSRAAAAVRAASTRLSVAYGVLQDCIALKNKPEVRSCVITPTPNASQVAANMALAPENLLAGVRAVTPAAELNGTTLTAGQIGEVSRAIIDGGGPHRVTIVRGEHAEEDMRAAFEANQSHYTQLEEVRRRYNEQARTDGRQEFGADDWYTMLARGRLALDGDRPPEQLADGSRAYPELTQAELYRVLAFALRKANVPNVDEAVEHGRTLLLSNVRRDLENEQPGREITLEAAVRRVEQTGQRVDASLEQAVHEGRIARGTVQLEAIEVRAHAQRQEKVVSVELPTNRSTAAGADVAVAPRVIAAAVTGERVVEQLERLRHEAQASFDHRLNVRYEREEALEHNVRQLVLRHRAITQAELRLIDARNGADQPQLAFRLPLYS